MDDNYPASVAWESIVTGQTMSQIYRRALAEVRRFWGDEPKVDWHLDVIPDVVSHKADQTLVMSYEARIRVKA